MTASKAAKDAGLKNLGVVVDMTEQSRQTLNNWYQDKPALFEVVIAGCAALQCSDKLNLNDRKLKMDVKKEPVCGTHCMMCDHSKNYDEDDRVPESCPVCGEHKEFTILHLDDLQHC